MTLRYFALMLRLRGIIRCLMLAALLCGGGGCFPSGGQVDEEQDPHFQRGRNLSGGQDFKGAAQEFEIALEANPHSAAAHFELGWLYDNKLNDPAAAIYHYQQHLQLLPNSPKIALINERIRGCKQQLSNTEFPLPHSRNLQADVDRLSTENVALKQQVETLKNQLAQAIAVAQSRPDPVRYTQPYAGGGGTTDGSHPTAPHGRTHIVQSGETMSAIAGKYSVRVSDIIAANPQVNPRKLHVGQTLNLP